MTFPPTCTQYRQPPHAAPSMGALLDDAARRLTNVSRTPRLDAEVLLSEAVGRTRTQLLTWPEARPTGDGEARFGQFLARRLRREPVAYIVGRREFYDLTLEVTRDVLIPRAETEVLVATALRWLSSRAQARVLDVGTGSAAIALAVARHAPGCMVVGSDISSAALDVARRNAQTHAVHNVEWRLGDLFDVVGTDEHFDLVLSNPPYVSPQEYANLEPNVREYEPSIALLAGKGGLAILRRLFAEAPRVLMPGGALGLEVGETQGQIVAEDMKIKGFRRVVIIPDLAGHGRVVWGET